MQTAASAGLKRYIEFNSLTLGVVLFSGPGYTASYGNPDMAYGGNSYPDPYGINKVCPTVCSIKKRSYPVHKTPTFSSSRRGHGKQPYP